MKIASDGLSDTYGFDGNGNPTTYKSAALTFDPENRMMADVSSLTAGYTGDNLRAWKQDNLGNRTYFLYDGADVIAELDATGTLTAYQTWGGNGLVSRHTSSSTFYTFDPVGSVSTVTNSAGAVQGDEAFDATGKRLGSFVSSPVSFCGQWGYYEDVETGLLLCGHRYYDPYIERFLNRDSIGYDGGINLYSYCDNDPTGCLDPVGTAVGYAGLYLCKNAYQDYIYSVRHSVTIGCVTITVTDPVFICDYKCTLIWCEHPGKCKDPVFYQNTQEIYCDPIIYETFYS